MVYVYSGSNSTAPIGKVMDYNNTDPSRGIKLYRLMSAASNPLTVQASNYNTSDFAQAIYGDGPYSLLRPNAISEHLANNIDLLA